MEKHKGLRVKENPHETQQLQQIKEENRPKARNAPDHLDPMRQEQEFDPDLEMLKTIRSHLRRVLPVEQKVEPPQTQEAV